jgi:hypothetical protein
MALKVPDYTGHSGERVTSFLGATYVHGYDGEIWYTIVTESVMPTDIDVMLSTRPRNGKVVINDKNIEQWRESVGIGDKPKESE